MDKTEGCGSVEPGKSALVNASTQPFSSQVVKYTAILAFGPATDAATSMSKVTSRSSGPPGELVTPLMLTGWTSFANGGFRNASRSDFLKPMVGLANSRIPIV